MKTSIKESINVFLMIIAMCIVFSMFYWFLSATGVDWSGWECSDKCRKFKQYTMWEYKNKECSCFNIETEEISPLNNLIKYKTYEESNID